MSWPPEPRYCIATLEENAPENIVAHTWMRRRGCCDCGRPVIYAPVPLLYELVRTYLVICHGCAHERTIEAGSMEWTYTVEPRPRPGLG